MSRTRTFIAMTLSAWLLLAAVPSSKAETSVDPAPSTTPKAEHRDVSLPAPDIPDVELLNQNGERVRFRTDLIEDRVVVIQFIFTSCTTICKPLSAVFKQVQEKLGPDADVQLISLTVDPTTDVPERLKAHAERFGAGPNWTMVTGDKSRITSVLRALGAFTADKVEHTPFILIGNDRTGKWLRTYGLASAETILEKIKDVSGSEDRAYFTDLPLIDQHGNRVRFYTDVLQGNLVVADFIFTRCTGICPLLTSTMRDVQERLADVVGDEVSLVSISIDPEYDTPEVLRSFARKFDAGPGWVFLTGKKENIDWVTHKLGAFAAVKEGHSPLFLVGDLQTGRWSKVMGTTAADELTSVVRKLLASR